jgi:hypothetical protein
MANLEEELKNMEEGLRRLKIEYHIFFNGNRKKPPEDLRLRLERLAKQLSERAGMTQAQRFRYTTLLTRYYTYRSLWRRILQEREKGLEPKSDKANLTAKPSPGARRSIEQFRISITDPKAEEDKVRSLYDALTRLKEEENSEESPAPFPQFAKFIAAQTHDIRNKYGCVSVAYVIAMEEGAIRFTAAAENP